MNTPRDVAAQVLDLVRASSGEAQAEVVVDTTELALTRFANSYIHQNIAESTTTVRLRLHHEGRTATGSSTVADAAGLGALVDRTVAAAALSPADPQWPGVAPAAPITPTAPVDEATAYADPDARAATVRAFVGAADGLEAAGYCSTLRWAVTFANSAGHTAAAETAEAALDAIARAGTSDGLARAAATRLADLDGAALGARAAAKALAGRDPIELPPGRYEVVLEPTAVVDLLQLIAIYGVNGKAVGERLSFIELGAAQFDPAVSLVDDPFDAGGVGLPFDIEGTPKRALTLVDAGVSTAVAHDRRSAAKAGAESTGHGSLGATTWGAIPTNVALLPAGDDGTPVAEVDGPAADSAVAELVARVGHGLLVTDNWYTRVLDPRTLVVTGLTRNGVWLIEDGQIARPVQNLRFTQSYPDALAAGSVHGIGTRSVALPSGWGVMTYRAPALHLASWNYTGNASG